MIDILDASATVLADAKFLTGRARVGDREALLFEDEATLGFLLAYPDPDVLIESWDTDANAFIAAHQFALRRSQQKAWNTYLVLFCSAPSKPSNVALLSAIEEDLTGTRKIVRANVRDVLEVRLGLLPLLPIQSAPKLEAVDMMAEIRARATEVPDLAVQGFLSKADEAVVLQAVEGVP
jgi:hypothetical protein